MNLEVTQSEVDALTRSLINYYLLVRIGVLSDNFVSDKFLSVIKEIERKGPSLFTENI